MGFYNISGGITYIFNFLHTNKITFSLLILQRKATLRLVLQAYKYDDLLSRDPGSQIHSHILRFIYRFF